MEHRNTTEEDARVLELLAKLMYRCLQVPEPPSHVSHVDWICRETRGEMEPESVSTVILHDSPRLLSDLWCPDIEQHAEPSAFLHLGAPRPLLLIEGRPPPEPVHAEELPPPPEDDDDLPPLETSDGHA